MRGFLLARIAGMGGEGMVERAAKNVLRVSGQMETYGIRQIVVDRIGHDEVFSREAAINFSSGQPIPPAASAQALIPSSGAAQVRLTEVNRRPRAPCYSRCKA
jgi:hypothetical protein